MDGAVTGRLTRPGSLLLGRYDDTGRLHYIGRTSPLATAPAQHLGTLLKSAPADHPWHGRRFSAGWGSRDPLHVTLCAPALVVEVSADISLDTGGRWRHPVRFLRTRTDLAPSDAPHFGEAAANS